MVLSAFAVITPPSAANAALACVAPVAASAFDMRMARTKRSELANFFQRAMLPLNRISPFAATPLSNCFTASSNSLKRPLYTVC